MCLIYDKKIDGLDPKHWIATRTNNFMSQDNYATTGSLGPAGYLNL